ncbi:MAG: hypothetical protein DME25_11250 [Verrucomicrobia bacterium]|nr:MAG: hypothetical protein DME25_11250 [Verrucomicrobiota bacterium]
MNMNTSFPRVLQQLKCAGAVLLLLITLRLAAANGPAAASASGPIALTSDDRFVWVVNPDNNSISVIEVGNDVNQRVTEIQVGEEPTSVAITPDNRKVYVTDRRSGTVSVIDASSQQVTGKIKVGTAKSSTSPTPPRAAFQSSTRARTWRSRPLRTLDRNRPASQLPATKSM